MSASAVESELLPLGQAAGLIGPPVQYHHLHRLARRGLIPFRRAGHVMLIVAADLPLVRAACVAAGYLKAEPEAAHAG